ncbi:methyl-accepting chemotaxis protein [Pseudobacteriovorax antillogorgiicola]|uniref:Methyl-accepting chemotaxis protein n=1 Tax=Pseudobacteriovorax antillogorgiicola TaxID=1513793 RepID=A0A1Y6C9N9_9BACT|nr:methyl-accepting chemotaxis protein [Pseudobacteriovorax antillogorgiicola]TCS51698.1 methyl-accepting chemotaxis protein [Pseudobacteriovorax antillogorgiicola]SMF49186.1 Methyl-accepting chemotaxis protein [Pseudobacteriovorax antillogorgiicola]
MKLRDLSISRKMMLLVLIPGISYLILASQLILDDVEQMASSGGFQERFEYMKLASKAIEETQVERGLSAVLLKAPNEQRQQRVEAQRAKNDPGWQALVDYANGHEDMKEYGDANGLYQQVLGLRKDVDSRAVTVSEGVSRYTKVVRSLIAMQSKLGQHTVEGFEVTSANNTLLQEARENAGLLRANLASTFAADKAIATSQLSKILSLRTGMYASLNSEVLQLDEEGRSTREKWSKEEHWRYMEQSVKILLEGYTKGAYGITGEQSFATSTLVVQDISQLIDRNFKSAETFISDFGAQALRGLGVQLIGILVNFALIVAISIMSIRSIHQKIDELIAGLSKASDRSQNSSASLSRASAGLSRSAQDTAAAIQETVSSMSEINSMVSSTLEKSKMTSSSSQVVSKLVDRGGESVAQLVTAMGEVKQSNERLREVNDVMRAISKQTGLINDIVFKTQLLAVNASIESAKAGEHGKGFAVVSEEVSKLAQSSGEAAEKITDLIDTSNQKVTDLLNSVNEKIFAGTEYTDEVRRLFEDIKTEVKDINSRAEDMNQAAKEQSLGVEQITTAVTNIDSSTQSNLQQIQDFESLTDELQAQSIEILDLSDRLEYLAYAVKHERKDGSNNSSGDGGLVSIANARKKTKPRPMETVEDDIADDPSFRPAAND